MDNLFQENNIEIKKNDTLINYDYNYKEQRIKRRQKTMFEAFTPRNNMNYLKIDNPKVIFMASDKINSILSKNLKSIYDEYKSDISNDNQIYDNVNDLIKKSNYSNKNILQKIIKSTINNAKDSNNYLSYGSFDNNSNNKFNDNEINNLKNSKNNSNLSSTTIINTTYLKKRLDLINNDKSDFLFDPKKIKDKIEQNNKTVNETNFTSKIKKSIIKKKPKNNFRTIAYNKNEFKKFMQNSNITIKNKRYSTDINKNDLSPSQKNNKKNNNNTKSNISSGFKNRSYNKRNKSMFFNRRFSSSNLISNKNSKTNGKIKTTRSRSVFAQNFNNRSMKILSLNEINNEINTSLIENRLEKVKKELKNFENNEVAEILNKFKINKRSKRATLADISLQQKYKSEFFQKSKQKMSKVIDLQETDEDKIQKKYRKIFLSKNLYDSLDDEEIMDEKKLYNFYISPNSITIYILDSLILISALIELNYMPLYISLHISSYKIYYDTISSIIFYITDIIYIIDLIAGFFKAYYNFEETLIQNNALIFLHYLTGWFIFDLMEAIPIFTFLNKNMKKLKNDENNFYDFELNNLIFLLTLLKSLKIFKIFMNNRTFTQINKYFDKSLFLYEWKGVFLTLFICLSTFHFCTCVFIFIGKNEFPGWIVKNNLQNNNFLDIYIAAFYYLMTTLTTVGYGDITANIGTEKIYGIIVLIVGTCAYSWILTYISNYIKKKNEKFIDFEEKMNILTEIKLEYPNIGTILYERIKRYLNYNKFQNKVNLKFILESLPSSLQNNLIIEIYKPIIKNFQFFKTFENSDFFVKIVTSLKPILSVKGDILIQEGDIIEDIIFIKNGVLSLQIIIDLICTKQSIESHLRMTENECFKNISYNKFNALRSINTINNNNKNHKSNLVEQFLDEKYKNKKEIKIIDLRKNEHFGDILMILNEKSPLAVKVKSKKAELFFLQKTEATEISNRYSNIWKRIVNRSLHNMKQIKNLIKQKIFKFTETYNLQLYVELKKKYNNNIKNNINKSNNKKSRHDNHKNNNTNENKNYNICEIIKEEDEVNSVITNKSSKSKKNLNIITENSDINNKIPENNQNENTDFFNIKVNSPKKKKVTFNEQSIISNKNDKEFNKIKENSNIKRCLSNSGKKEEKSMLKNSLKKVNFVDEKEMNINNNLEEVNDMISMIDQKVKNTSSRKLVTNFNIHIYAPKIEFPIKTVNIKNKNKKNTSNYMEAQDNTDSNITSENNNNKIINNDNNIINNNKNSVNNSYDYYKINSEISFNHEFESELKNDGIIMNNGDENNYMYFSNIKNISNKLESSNNYNSNVNSNIIKLFGKKRDEKIESNINNNNEKTEVKIDDNASIKSISSNKSITNYKSGFSCLYTSQSTSFTIESSYENINIISKNNYYKDMDLREKTKKFILEEINKENKFEIYPIKTQKASKTTVNLLSPKRNLKIIRLRTIKKKYDYSKNDNLFPDNDFIPIRKSFTKSPDILKNNDNVAQESKISPVSLNFKKSISIKKRPKNNSVIKYDDNNEKTFYSKIRRIKTMHKKKLASIQDDKEIKNENINYEKLISKNIENNKKNLNNPEMYFEGFFNDIIFKSNEINNDNYIEDKKELKKVNTFDK